MQIINKSKNTVLATNVLVADRLLARVKGLLGKKNLPQNEALIIRPCNSVHTFFMRFPIDILFVDAHNKVVKTSLNIPAFRITGIYLRSSFVIELPAGTIAVTSTQCGDTLLISGYPV